MALGEKARGEMACVICVKRRESLFVGDERWKEVRIPWNSREIYT